MPPTFCEVVRNNAIVEQLGAVQKRANLVMLDKCCKRSLQLQKPASILPRTELLNLRLQLTGIPVIPHVPVFPKLSLGRLDCLLGRVHLPAQHEGLRADLAGRAGTVGNAAEHDIGGTAASLAIVAAGREFLVQRNVAKTHVRAAHDLLRPDAEDAVRFRGAARAHLGDAAEARRPTAVLTHALAGADLAVGGVL